MDNLIIQKDFATSALIQALKEGPFGVPALTLIAAAIVVPICQYRTMYGISVGYGGSVAFMAHVLQRVFDETTPTALSQTLIWAAIFYGLRLSTHLLVRDFTGWKPQNKDPNRKDPSRLARIPFSIMLSLLYSFMTSPLLYFLRNPPPKGSLLEKFSQTGVVLAWVGAVMEAIADAHKFWVKAHHRSTRATSRTSGNKKKDSPTFCGPSGGVYRLTRHPNYTGEILFWLGLYIAGLPAIGGSYLGYVYSTLGHFGIVFIMVGATKRLEERHEENYGGQRAYEEWKAKVPAPLIPLIKG